MQVAGVVLRRADAADADDIARIMRAALSSFVWMPLLHTPDEDKAFVQGIVSTQQVTVAQAEMRLVGFIAIRDDWVEQLYIEPGFTGRGIGSRLLAAGTAGIPVAWLHCFQANTGARRFYERHGFSIEALADGSSNEEGLPDILYVRRAAVGNSHWI